jgi:hypothetical protein
MCALSRTSERGPVRELRNGRAFAGILSGSFDWIIREDVRGRILRKIQNPSTPTRTESAQKRAESAEIRTTGAELAQIFGGEAKRVKLEAASASIPKPVE